MSHSPTELLCLPFQESSREDISPAEALDKLFDWMQWRTAVNDGLSQDILTESFTHVPSITSPQLLSLLGKPSIYRYGIAPDQATFLDEREFLNFGLPRAQASFLPLNAPKSNISLESSSPRSSASVEYSKSDLDVLYWVWWRESGPQSLRVAPNDAIYHINCVIYITYSPIDYVSLLLPTATIITQQTFSNITETNSLILTHFNNSVIDIGYLTYINRSLFVLLHFIVHNLYHATSIYYIANVL